MKRLIADVYKTVYKISGAKSFSIIFAIAYISALNLISIYGLGLLMEGWMPTRFVHKLFASPYYIFTTIAMLLFNLWMMTPLKNLSKERNKPPFYPSIIAYTLISILLLLYIHYKDMLPN